MEFDEEQLENYTLLNEGQGLLIPNDWEVALGKLSFNGQFLTAGSYMPWFGQVKGGAGYIAIASTPWNGVNAASYLVELLSQVFIKEQLGTFFGFIH